RRQELQRGRFRGGGGDDDGVFQGAVVFQGLHELRDGRALLADGDVDAIELLRFVTAGVHRLLVQNGVESDGGLAGLAIADDQLTLATSDRHQAVDGLEAGLHRLMHRLTRDDAGGLHFDALALDIDQRTLAVDRIAETVDHATEQAAADRNVDDGTGTLDGIAFLDGAVVAKNHDTDIVGLEVQRHTTDTTGEFDHLTGLDIVQTMHAGNAVADRQHLADFGNVGLIAEILNLLLENGGNFGGADFHYPTPFMESCSFCSLVFSELSIIRLPIRTIRPPSNEGSTLTSIATEPPPTTRLIASLTAACCWAVSARAAVTSAATSPRLSASNFR